MSIMRNIIRRNGAVFLALALSVIGLKAIVPAGHMVAPTTGYFISIVPCPSTNALARAFAAKADRAETMHQAHVDHAAMGHGAVDHAALGHQPSTSDDAQGDNPSASQPQVDCAFSSLAFAATLPDKPGLEHSAAVAGQASTPPLPALVLVRSRYLRPPLRAPPLHA
jgi:hypothetical protein